VDSTTTTGTFTNRALQYLKHQTFNGMGAEVADYNNDGKVDIVVLDMLPEDNKRWKLTSRGNTYDEFQNGIRNGYEHQYIRNTLQLNNGNGSFSEIGQIAELKQPNGVGVHCLPITITMG
jgi:hypothetical protein